MVFPVQFTINDEAEEGEGTNFLKGCVIDLKIKKRAEFLGLVKSHEFRF